jgi:hypothetical protein
MEPRIIGARRFFSLKPVGSGESESFDWWRAEVLVAAGADVAVEVAVEVAVNEGLTLLVVTERETSR